MQYIIIMEAKLKWTTALEITFDNLPIIKIKAVEKKVAHHGWATEAPIEESERNVFKN